MLAKHELTGTGDARFLLTPGDSAFTGRPAGEPPGDGLRRPLGAGPVLAWASPGTSAATLFISDPSPLIGIGFTT